MRFLRRSLGGLFLFALTLALLAHAGRMLWSAVETAMAAHTDRLLHWLDSAPQTNEVRRSAALIPALRLRRLPPADLVKVFANVR